MSRIPSPTRRRDRYAARIGAILTVSLALCAALAPPAAPAFAARKSEDGAKYAINDKRLARTLIDVREQLSNDHYAEAKKLLDGIRLRWVHPYPLGLIHQMYGYIAANSEDYETAVVHFQKALDTKALPPAQMKSIRFNLGQIYMVLDRWEDAIEAFETWFSEEENPTAMAYYMLGIAYYQANRTEEALAPAKKAVEMSDDPRENWMQLLLALHMTDKDYDEALPLLKRMALRYPKPAYWKQLAAVLMELGKDSESLAVQQLAYAQGFLEADRDLVRLAQMHAFLGMPWQGAKILEEGLEAGSIESDADAWQLLANSLLTARENESALEPLERAASLAENGNTYVRLAQVYMQSERWSDALGALDRAFGKGNLSNPAQAHLLVGISAYQQHHLGAARNAFRLALHDAQTRDIAKQYIDLVDRELANASEKRG